MSDWHKFSVGQYTFLTTSSLQEMQEEYADEEVKEIKEFTADDYAEIMGNGFEEENYHSMTEVPRKILGILEKHVSDKTVILSIMKSLYDEGLP